MSTTMHKAAEDSCERTRNGVMIAVHCIYTMIMCAHLTTYPSLPVFREAFRSVLLRSIANVILTTIFPEAVLILALCEVAEAVHTTRLIRKRLGQTGPHPLLNCYMARLIKKIQQFGLFRKPSSKQ